MKHKINPNVIIAFVSGFGIGVGAASVAFSPLFTKYNEILKRDRELLMVSSSQIDVLQAMVRSYMYKVPNEVNRAVYKETEFNFVVHDGMMPEWIAEEIRKLKEE